MTKEEQLKIYSAYLPYKLELRYLDFPDGKEQKAYLSGVTETEIETTYKRKQNDCSGDYISWEGNNNVFDLKVKPILYDLSYLSKEIEHEGERIVLAEKIFKREWQDIAEYYVRCNQIMKLRYDNIQLLLKHHINVFNLPEDQFINKSNITQKQ